MDCTKVKNFTYTTPPPLFVVYEIGQPAVQTIIKAATDPMSTPVPGVCGPIEYNLYGTDATGTQTLSLPDYLAWMPENRQFDVFSLSVANAGKFYVIFEAFYTNIKADKNCHREKSLITLQLNLPPVVQTVALPVAETS